MPGWHEATRELRADDRLQFVGIIEEQHPERCRLFMQWKRMDWPVLVDALDLLDVAVVPLTVLIDEHGIVRRLARSPSDGTLEAFLATEYGPPSDSPTRAVPPDLEALERRAREGTPAERRTYGEALLLWGGPERLDRSIEVLEEVLAATPDDGRAAFSAGVAYRRRYDTGGASPDDFTRAVERWAHALDTDPNQYIWRRRLQQYGPRLDKPYPFYDWVAEARVEIERRGEEPSALPVEPRGAEIARPAREFETAAETDEPDAGGRIHRDPGQLIDVNVTRVPPVLDPGSTVRVHLEFRPNAEADAHWNNEAKPMVVWVEPPEGWQTDTRRVELPLPASPVSAEPRRVELELLAPEAAEAARLSGYALYYVCKGADGQCLYRRQDLDVPLTFR